MPDASLYVCRFVSPWEALSYRPSSAASFDCSGLPDTCYKAICGLLLPMLDLEASRRNHAMSQSPVTPSTGPGVAQEKDQCTSRPEVPCQLTVRPPHLEEPLGVMLVGWGGN